ncbi:putative bifunctional diguanylate cyclase/phosphodiesterase [Dokdonella sp.]|uniref:putative bifunctional diguanylate cyclase/phosphodiesterase n=1 Tax=Dokdonella sp. TaxID=2291710 RepID=UPI0031BF75C5|nr:EAL domain-containing protein [Dokdonella sp.]
MTLATPSEALQAIQNATLEAIAGGTPLPVVIERLAREICTLVPEARCVVLHADADSGLLRPLAAPDLPERLLRALDGLPARAEAHCCAAAAGASQGEHEDFATEAARGNLREVAAECGFRACWSVPIVASDGATIGRFTFYYPSARGPGELERLVARTCVQLCAIALERDAAQSQVQRLAFQDSLTGLPNRSRFREHARGLIDALQPGQGATLLMIDLDDFKDVNESLGRRAGDRLLKEVGARLAQVIGEQAFFARVGGDTFAAIRSGDDAPDVALELSRQISRALDEPFESRGQKVAIGACIGIAHALSSNLTLAELSHRADLALYDAKSAGRRNCRVYAPELAAAARLRRCFKQDIRNAMDRGEFALAYQPIVALANNRVVAFEALLRWSHPERGLVSPATFIPVAEEIGLIGALGDWVLHEACRTAAGWPKAIRVGVNLSPLQVGKARFALDVVGALQHARLDPHRLDLEITESALLARDLATRTTLHDLHDFGVRLSLDDFGTGFSSLAALRWFPFDTLKIDMSFVSDLDVDADSTAIVRAVIGLARDLGIKTVAEGVETESQHHWLIQNSCAEGQGYRFGRPMGTAQVEALLRQAGEAPLSLTLPRDGGVPTAMRLATPAASVLDR